jgi:hypothetical protein
VRGPRLYTVSSPKHYHHHGDETDGQIQHRTITMSILATTQEQSLLRRNPITGLRLFTTTSVGTLHPQSQNNDARARKMQLQRILHAWDFRMETLAERKSTSILIQVVRHQIPPLNWGLNPSGYTAACPRIRSTFLWLTCCLDIVPPRPIRKW